MVAAGNLEHNARERDMKPRAHEGFLSHNAAQHRNCILFCHLDHKSGAGPRGIPATLV